MLTRLPRVTYPMLQKALPSAEFEGLGRARFRCAFDVTSFELIPTLALFAVAAEADVAAAYSSSSASDQIISNSWVPRILTAPGTVTVTAVPGGPGGPGGVGGAAGSLQLAIRFVTAILPR
jgi:hypothetical protein